jgi:hypothetical protein
MPLAPESDPAPFSLRPFPRAVGKSLMVPGAGGCGQHKEAARAQYLIVQMLLEGQPVPSPLRVLEVAKHAGPTDPIRVYW